MARTKSLLLALAFGAGSLVTSGPAGAYCRTKACDTEPSYGDAWDDEPQPTECTRNAQGCLLQGTPLFWQSRCMNFGVQRDGSGLSNVDFETARDIIQAGFDTWAAADCGGDTPSFRVVDKGAIACAHIEYNQDAPNANVFLFRDADWPYHNLGGDALALTTVTFSVETGEIYDADVELNSFDTLFTTSDEPGEIVSDLSSVLTHEIGHFLGLSHSEESTAVMRGIGYTPGSTELRYLTPDDIAGICEIYPPGKSTSGSCTPRHGFSTKCGSASKKTEGGCTLGPPGAHGTPRVAGFLALALGMLGLRRMRVTR
jgi:hypothetical protein